MYKMRHKNLPLYIFLFLALSVRIYALFSIDSLREPQVWEHEHIANNLLAGNGLQYIILNANYRNTAMVLYPLICAIIYYFTNHSFLIVKIFQVVLSLITCFLIYKIAKELAGEKIGLVALALISFHPALIVYSVRLHPLVLDTFLFTLFIYLLFCFFDKNKMVKYAFLIGLCIGITLLTKAIIGIFVPLLLIAILMKLPRKMAMASIAVILIGISLPLLILFTRNYIVFKRMVIFPNDSGINFWVGNNPFTIGAANTLDGDSPLFKDKNFLRKLDGLDEFGQKDLFYREGLNFIRNNPKEFIALFFKKLCYFWWFSPVTGLNYPKHWTLIYKAYYTFILIFVLLGIYGQVAGFPEERKFKVSIIILFIFSISIAQAVYYVDGRHRLAVEPLILVLASTGIYTLCKNVQRKKRVS